MSKLNSKERKKKKKKKKKKKNVFGAFRSIFKVFGDEVKGHGIFLVKLLEKRWRISPRFTVELSALEFLSKDNYR